MCIHSLEKGQTSYTSNSGLPELRDELTRTYYRRYGLDYNPESEILITTGVSEALDMQSGQWLIPEISNCGSASLCSICPFSDYGRRQPVIVSTQGR